MDDVSCLWNRTAQTFSNSLMFLNYIFLTIKFTAEFDGKTMNFLDLNTSTLSSQFVRLEV